MAYLMNVIIIAAFEDENLCVFEILKNLKSLLIVCMNQMRKSPDYGIIA